MSQASVCRSDNEFNKPCVQEQGVERPIATEENNEAILTVNKEINVRETQVKKLEADKILLETRFQESKLLNLTEEVAELREAKGKLEAEIKLLKDQIKKLKAEKDALQKQLNNLDNKYVGLEKEFAELEGSNLVLEEKVDHLEGKNKNLEEDIGDLKKVNKDLQEDVGNLKKENKDLQEDIGVLKRELHMANRPFLVLGELCFQIPSLMYQKVFPQWYDKSGFYLVQDFEKHIKELGDEEGEESKNLAQKTWTELKRELNWEEKYVRSLKTVRHSRNTTAHPPIDEELLYKAAKEAKENEDLNNYTYNNIMELIGIWKKLNDMK